MRDPAVSKKCKYLCPSSLKYITNKAKLSRRGAGSDRHRSIAHVWVSSSTLTYVLIRVKWNISYIKSSCVIVISYDNNIVWVRDVKIPSYSIEQDIKFHPNTLHFCVSDN